jgi:hypothetical protein
MGDSAIATKVEIRWPSGVLQTLTDVKADRQIQVDEPVNLATRPTLGQSQPQ